MKRDALDDLFSKLVRERAGWCCEACGKYYPEGQRQGLHCSHHYSRRHNATRWEPLNASAHCFSCHQHLSGNPVLFAYWIKTHLERLYGPHAFGALEEKHQSIVKLTRADKAELKAHMKAELKRLQDERAAGTQGRIEFVGYL